MKFRAIIISSLVAVQAFLVAIAAGWILQVDLRFSVGFGLAVSLFFFFGILLASRRPAWSLRNQRRIFLSAGSILTVLGIWWLWFPLSTRPNLVISLAFLAAAISFGVALYLSRLIKKEPSPDGRVPR